ncbi:MAG: SpoIVB peptidase [Lachnospiraceae bacterium]|nr:SpoIVB peptidase [Lachnospiraceae bacterium]MDE6254145.1 SpoIVB peptidase [Lachnospiraceae bacterium]
MTRKSYYRRILIMLLIASVIYTIEYGYRYINNNIPDSINLHADSENSYDLKVPVAATVSSEDKEVSIEGYSGILNREIKISTNDNALSNDESLGKYNVDVKLFGIFNFKSIEVNVIEKQKVIPCGFPVGIYLETDGIMVIGTGTVKGMDGNVYNPAESKVNSGDYIVSLNDIPVSSKSQLIFLVNKYGSDDIILGIRRNGQIIKVLINPVETAVSEYKMGIWVRDDTQGIGTLTFITEDGKFGALGHGISDIDTGKLLDSNTGILYEADIWGIKKGENGTPGGLCGVVIYENNCILGKINANTDRGIFGQAEDELMEICDFQPVDMSFKQDVHKGAAYIRCMLDGEIKDYEIEIVSVDRTGDAKNKGMVIQVTDPELLSLTNGIVQGMSGSPIIQDGKLAGAVTHVLVNDPTKGYGIFAEDMMK